LTPLHLKLGTQTKAPADKPDVDHIIGQTPQYDPRNPTLVPQGSIVNVQLGVPKAEPPPPTPPVPVAQPHPEAAPIEKDSIVVPGITNFTLNDAMITVLKKGLTPIIHLIHPSSRPSRDVVLAQFPREDTLVASGAAVIITTETDDPAKERTYVKISPTDGTGTVIDFSEARRLTGMPDHHDPRLPQ
jgi:hypothetical protein